MGIQLNGTSGTDVISAVDGSLTVEGLNVSGNFNITGNILGTQDQTFIGANTSDGSCSFSYTLGADPDVLFHFDASSAESCSSGVTLTVGSVMLAGQIGN